MTIRHAIDYYMDGYQMVAFCKTCSAEGDKLLEPCSGKIIIHDEKFDLTDRTKSLNKSYWRKGIFPIT